MQAFSEAAEGIRTLDLLHGKQGAWDGRGPQRASKEPVLSHVRAQPGVWDFTSIYGSLRND